MLRVCWDLPVLRDLRAGRVLQMLRFLRFLLDPRAKSDLRMRLVLFGRMGLLDCRAESDLLEALNPPPRT